MDQSQVIISQNTLIHIHKNYRLKEAIIIWVVYHIVLHHEEAFSLVKFENHWSPPYFPILLLTISCKTKLKSLLKLLSLKLIAACWAAI